MKAIVLEIPGMGLEGQCGDHTGTLLSNPRDDLRNLDHSGPGVGVGSSSLIGHIHKEQAS